jgi:hypothetical protein
MNKPNLVDSKLIENLLNKSSNNIIPSISTNAPQNIASLFRKYWLAILVVICVVIFIVYHTKNEKKKIKETFTNKKLKKRKKIEKFINEDVPPMQYPQQQPIQSGDKPKCLTCKDNKAVNYKHDDHDHYEEQIPEQLPEQYYQENMEQGDIQYQEPVQQQSSYENQYYGQSITEDFTMNNGIESFNSASYGNFVAF